MQSYSFSLVKRITDVIQPEAAGATQPLGSVLHGDHYDYNTPRCRGVKSRGGVRCTPPPVLLGLRGLQGKNVANVQRDSLTAPNRGTDYHLR